MAWVGGGESEALIVNDKRNAELVTVKSSDVRLHCEYAKYVTAIHT